MADPKRLRVLGERVVAELKATHQKLIQAEGIWAIARLIPVVVAQAEALSEELAGEEKKGLVLEVLFSLVKLPWWAPRAVVEPLASWLIEKAVAKANEILKK